MLQIFERCRQALDPDNATKNLRRSPKYSPIAQIQSLGKNREGCCPDNQDKLNLLFATILESGFEDDTA
jgi:hypothetical protein